MFEALHLAFNFTVDACASADNALLPRYWTAEQDCRKQVWDGERVFCNPPFRETKTIWPKAREAELAVMLVPVNAMATDYSFASPPDVMALPQKRIIFDLPDGRGWKTEKRAGGAPCLPCGFAIFGRVTDWQVKCLLDLRCQVFCGLKTAVPIAGSTARRPAVPQSAGVRREVAEGTPAAVEAGADVPALQTTFRHGG